MQNGRVGKKTDEWYVFSRPFIPTQKSFHPTSLPMFFINDREELDCSIRVTLFFVGFFISIHCTLNCDINCKCSVKGFFALQYKDFSLCPSTALPLSFNGRPQDGEAHAKKAEQQGGN